MRATGLGHGADADTDADHEATPASPLLIGGLLPVDGLAAVRGCLLGVVRSRDATSRLYRIFWRPIAEKQVVINRADLEIQMLRPVYHSAICDDDARVLLQSGLDPCRQTPGCTSFAVG